MIKKIYIENFKLFSNFTLEFRDECNIIVGDNESGKSTLLEAINIALTRRFNGRFLESELTSHLFNQGAVRAFFGALKRGENATPPRILIELTFADDPGLEFLRGTNNSQREDALGVRVEVVFNDEYAVEYARFTEEKTGNTSLPTEYYKVNWLAFSGNPVPTRGLPLLTTLIDASTIRLQSGTDYYMQGVINDTLDPKEKVELSIAYRALKEEFYAKPSIGAINQRLELNHGDLSAKKLSVGLDVSQRAGWESGIVPHLDEIPFQYIGKGEQSRLKILLALQRHTGLSRVILIEEPESHLSYSSLNELVSQIEDKCRGKQVVMTTHNAFVLNKVGLDRLVLLAGQKELRLSALSGETEQYFKKLPGYDTLRLILAKKIVLVEGPSDELILQKAYRLAHGSWPHEAGIDVMSVGLAFGRFLEIAAILAGIQVVVVTDNDGNPDRVQTKFAEFEGFPNIHVCFSKDTDLRTLEPHMAAVNSPEVLSRVLGRSFNTREDASEYMLANKTESALKIFEYQGEGLNFPAYIQEAVHAVK